MIIKIPNIFITMYFSNILIYIINYNYIKIEIVE